MELAWQYSRNFMTKCGMLCNNPNSICWWITPPIFKSINQWGKARPASLIQHQSLLLESSGLLGEMTALCSAYKKNFAWTYSKLNKLSPGFWTKLKETKTISQFLKLSLSKIGRFGAEFPQLGNISVNNFFLPAAQCFNFNNIFLLLKGQSIECRRLRINE